MEATTDLHSFSDLDLLDHDVKELLARLATNFSALQKKVATCNEKLSRLNDSLDEVASVADKK